MTSSPDGPHFVDTSSKLNPRPGPQFPIGCEPLPTIVVIDARLGRVTINESDFDPARHTLAG